MREHVGQDTIMQINLDSLAGLALGIALMHLPWRVIGIILAGPESYYKQQQADLLHAFASSFGNFRL